MRAKVLVTGAAGFVGRALCRELLTAGYGVRALIRSQSLKAPSGEHDLEIVHVPGIGRIEDWSGIVAGCDFVVHLAAHVHQMRSDGEIDHSAYERVNNLATQRLGSAAAGRVKRMVFLSTVKVHGERTPPDMPFQVTDTPDPQDDYAASKWQAEEALRRLADSRDLDYCVLRPPLVYGPGVGANFLRLMRLVHGGLPIPLGSVRNKRSMVYVGNLVSAVMACLENDKARGATYLVGDGEDVATPELLRAIAAAMGRPARLVPVPETLLRAAGKMTGKSAEVARLLDSLTVDTSALQTDLDWSPPYSMEQGLIDTARWFVQRNS